MASKKAVKKKRRARKNESASGRTRRYQSTWNRVSHVVALMRSDNLSMRQAAKEVGISPSTVLRWGKSALRKDGAGRYRARKSDLLVRILIVPSPDGPREIAVRNTKQSSMVGSYWDAVRKFLRTGDSLNLRQFEGKFLTDVSGKRIPLLTDQAELERLGSAGVLTFESIYSRS